MKILFFRMASYFSEKNPHPENVLMPIDIATMATIAENFGHDISLLDTEAVHFSFEELITEIERVNPDLIVIKAKSPSNQDIINLFEDSRLSKMPFRILGIGHTFGTDAEFFFKTKLPLYCTISREPELSFKEVLQLWGDNDFRSQIKGITYMEGGRIVVNPDMPLAENLDTLPRPKYDWFLNEKYFSQFPIPLFLKRRMAFMLATRGCPMKCIYCSPNLRQSTGAKVRTHSVDRMVEDMKYLQDKKIPIVSFRDDIFTMNRKFVMDLCDEIIKKKLKIKWMAQTHINHVDEELLINMKKANCITIAYGLESGSEKVLKNVKKYNDLNHAIKMFNVCKKIGLKTVGYFIVGNPGETMADIELTKQFINKINPDLMQVALFTPYKGSEAYKMLDEKLKVGDGGYHHYNKVGYNFSEIETHILETLPKEIYLEYILRPKNFIRFSIQSIIDLFVNTKLILKLIKSAFKFLILKHNKIT
jgi:anaerobic magnesium-protoporphyrin IX monomethyl ester cyclase